MTPKQSRETAEALLQVLGDKAPAELREALAEPARARQGPTKSQPGTRHPRRARARRHYYRQPRLPREHESTAPLAWFAALLVGGACLLSIIGSCENQRAVSTWSQRR
jgi:hypothetical protein